MDLAVHLPGQGLVAMTRLLVDTADYAAEAVTTFPGLFTIEFTDPPLPIAGGRAVWAAND